MNLPEKYRHKKNIGPMPATKEGEPFGVFLIPQKRGAPLMVVMHFSDDKTAEHDEGWSHVSVSLPTRCPTWEEMCRVKQLFFGDEVAVQFHPKEEDYVNMHKYCLHLFHHKELQTPPSILVGIPGVEL